MAEKLEKRKFLSFPSSQSDTLLWTLLPKFLNALCFFLAYRAMDTS